MSEDEPKVGIPEDKSVKVDIQRLLNDKDFVTSFSQDVGTLVAEQLSKRLDQQEKTLKASIAVFQEHESRVRGLLVQAEQRETQVKASLKKAKQTESTVKALLEQTSAAEKSLNDHIIESKADLKTSTSYITALSLGVIVVMVVIVMSILIVADQALIGEKVSKGFDDIEIKILKGEYKKQLERCHL